ncbi:MAG: 50S ribosomal protein L13 [Candidatus Omnitrophica bacterium]|nr:50S ribosomal protein L13 [Candidatus Omnitrophota bacterium]
MKTYMAKTGQTDRKWMLLNADGAILGRLASKAAVVLRGKHKAVFTPHVDCGDGVVVINAAKIRVTGDKLKGKIYTHYSGYPDGLKKESLASLLKRDPAQVIRRAIKGMLPKNSLGDDLIRHLKIYAGAEHEQKAQQPTELTIKSVSHD